MKSAASPKATEERLEEIRKVAAEAAQVPAGVRPSAGSPQKREGESYYGLPALKPPVWTWEVPLYFFLGGIAGLSACIGFAAQLLHGAPELIRLCLWVGFLGAAICPVLLIADLGRPRRFLNMLRVFKLQSAMSMGAWILVAFSGCVFLAVLCFELYRRGFTHPLLIALLWLAEANRDHVAGVEAARGCAPASRQVRPNATRCRTSGRPRRPAAASLFWFASRGTLRSGCNLSDRCSSKPLCMDLGGPRFGQRPSGLVSTSVQTLRNGFVLERAFEVKKETRMRNVPLCEVPTIAGLEQT